MQKYIGILLLWVGSATASFCQPSTSLEHLRQQIDSVLGVQKGFFALAFSDLSTGRHLYLHEKEIFHAASTMKTPVMIELFKQSASGIFSLNDSLVVKNQFASIADSSFFRLDSADDSETDLYTHIGEKLPISALLYKMITVSSNLSTNLLIELVHPKKVQETMRDLGAMDMRILRGVEDTKAFEKGMNNTTTAFDLMLLFEKMARGQIVSPAACADMIRILEDQHFRSIIPAFLPPEAKVAHKTGYFSGVEHDSGIVFGPSGRKYVLVILSKDLADDAASVKAMATVSLLIYQFLFS